MKIAIFGGSFNPIHNGHIGIAKDVHEKLDYDKIIFIPANHSPFKSEPDGADNNDRLQMLKIAVEPFPWAIVDDCEIVRSGISYTSDTIEYISNEYIKKQRITNKIGLIIGSDLVQSFHKWHNVDEFMKYVDLIIMHRNNSIEFQNNLKFPFTTIENKLFDVSSSEIRELIQKQKDFSFLVPQVVFEYIKCRGLYGYKL